MPETPEKTGKQTPTGESQNRGDLHGKPEGKPAPDPDRVAKLEARLTEIADRLASADAEKAAAKKAADEAIEAAKRDKMSNAEKHAADVNDLKLQLKVFQEREQAGKRDAALAELKVKPAYREFAPKVDATTDDGRATLEAWAQARPEIRDAAGGLNRTPTAPMPSFDDDVMSSPFFNADSVKASMDAAASMDRKANSGR